MVEARGHFLHPESVEIVQIEEDKNVSHEDATQQESENS